MCEVKAADEIEDPVVTAKAAAAVTWCERASEHERANGGKAWRYLLIPHDEVKAATGMRTLVDRFTKN